MYRRLVNSDPSVRPENCGQLLAALESAKFVMAYRHIGHNVSPVTEIFQLCLSNPKALAEFLNGVDQNVSKVSQLDKSTYCC